MYKLYNKYRRNRKSLYKDKQHKSYINELRKNINSLNIKRDSFSKYKNNENC